MRHLQYKCFCSIFNYSWPRAYDTQNNRHSIIEKNLLLSSYYRSYDIRTWTNGSRAILDYSRVLLLGVHMTWALVISNSRVFNIRDLVAPQEPRSPDGASPPHRHDASQLIDQCAQRVLSCTALPSMNGEMCNRTRIVLNRFNT